MSSALRFAGQAAGSVLGPLMIQTAVLAFAPSLLSDAGHPLLLTVGAVLFGALVLWPTAWTLHAVALRVVYVVVMFFAAIIWTLVMYAGYFPQRSGMRWLTGDL